MLKLLIKESYPGMKRTLKDFRFHCRVTLHNWYTTSLIYATFNKGNLKISIELSYFTRKTSVKKNFVLLNFQRPLIRISFLVCFEAFKYTF